MGKIEDIARIHHKCLIEEFKAVGIEVDISLRHLEKKWSDYKGLIVTEEENEKFVGFAALDEPMIYVDPEYQRQGKGSRLLEISKMKSVWVMDGNEKAEKFYKKNGFEPMESREVNKLEHDITERNWVKNEVS